VRLAEDTHLGLLVHDLAPERILGLKTGDQNGVARVLDIVPEMMKNAPRATPF
jgi:hypothetical protein